MSQRDQLEFQFRAAANPASQPREHGRDDASMSATLRTAELNRQTFTTFGIFSRHSRSVGAILYS